MAIVNPYLKKKKPAKQAPKSAVPKPAIITPHKAPALPKIKPHKASVLPKVTASKASALPKISPLNKTVSSKAKQSVKQRLKQEIAALKKQKQLHKLQKEAEERRRIRLQEKKAEQERKAAERERYLKEKQAQKEKLLKLKEEERLRKQREKEEKQRQKQRLLEAKQQEKLRKEEAKRLLHEQKLEREERLYQTKLEAWKHHQKLWWQQQEVVRFFHQLPPPLKAVAFQKEELRLRGGVSVPIPPVDALLRTYNSNADVGFRPLVFPWEGVTIENVLHFVGRLRPPPPPPQRPILWQPRKTKRKPKVLPPPLLCDPLEAPSPFSNRYLVTVLVVRDPRTEKSFGVNLKLHQESALVDPDWAGLKKVADKKLKESCKSQRNNGLPHSKSTPPSEIRQVVRTCLEDLITSVETKQGSTALQNCKGSPKFQRNVDLSLPHSKNTPEPNDPSLEIRQVVKTCLEDLVTSVEAKQGPKPVQKRRRRRRVNFSVMMVTDAAKQNARKPDVDSEAKLQPDDIVVSIEGHALHGLPFGDACAIFSREAKTIHESLIQTKVIVARKPKVVKPPPKVEPVEKLTVVPTPPKSSTIAAAPDKTPKVFTSPEVPTVPPPLPPPDNTSMVFTPSEIAALSSCVFHMLHSSKRILGQDLNEPIWQSQTLIFRMGAALKDTPISPRGRPTLQNKWLELTRLMDYDLVQNGKTFWSKTLRDEFGDRTLPFSTEVERNAMRHLPRPSKGCRCKQTDHEYLFDPKCVLFHNLQKRLSKTELQDLRSHKTNKALSTKRDLNTVESAYKNRMLKLKIATENESIEARFVDKMEEIQVKELRQAVFAPNLTTMVLSTVFELQREFHVAPEDREKKDIPDEDDDDDVPLERLGKGETGNGSGSDSKKQKLDRERDPSISLKYLIRMLEYVTKTWGHCYREPDSEEFAWRWELFHAVHSNHDQWEANAKTPRVPGSFPFEHVQLGLNPTKSTRNELSEMPKSIRQFEDLLLSGCAPSPLEISKEILDYFCMTVHLLSPSRTGLYDELLALLKMGILKVSPSGIPFVTDDWWAKIDIVVLDDMNSSWSTKADPDSRHCVNEEFRDVLEEQWLKSSRGWALQDNPRELIFDFAVLDEWRETFEGQLEERANASEGIGLFGL